MKLNHNEITIVLISHNSKELVKQFIKNFSKKINFLIIDNSNDLNLKKELGALENVEIKFMENKGYGSAINFARKFIKTNFFFVFSPDIKKPDDTFIEIFLEKIKDIGKFAALGPRFLNVTHKSHKQSNPNHEVGQIDVISGSAMLFDVKTFDDIGGFDENIFLYFEDTDFGKRAKKKGYKIFQINTAKVSHTRGADSGVVKVNDVYAVNKLENLYTWHFIWSKFYLYKKHYNKLLALIIFIPIIIRILFRITLYSIKKNNKKKEKYLNRLEGFLYSVKGMNSSKRL